MAEKTILGVDLRRLIIKVINGMGGKQRIRVRFRGTRAYTDGTNVNLPGIRDLAEIPYATARALIGYAIHEVAHIIYTEFDAIIRAINEGRMQPDMLIKKFENAIEDYRIERNISGDLPGTASDLEALRNLIHPSLSKLKPAWFADPRVCGPLALTWTGSVINGFNITPMQETLDAFPAPVKALIDNWTGRMKDVVSTDEAVDLAIQFAAEAMAYAKVSQTNNDPAVTESNDNQQEPGDQKSDDSAGNDDASDQQDKKDDLSEPESGNNDDATSDNVSDDDEGKAEDPDLNEAKNNPADEDDQETAAPTASDDQGDSDSTDAVKSEQSDEDELSNSDQTSSEQTGGDDQENEAAATSDDRSEEQAGDASDDAASSEEESSDQPNENDLGEDDQDSSDRPEQSDDHDTDQAGEPDGSENDHEAEQGETNGSGNATPDDLSADPSSSSQDHRNDQNINDDATSGDTPEYQASGSEPTADETSGDAASSSQGNTETADEGLSDTSSQNQSQAKDNPDGSGQVDMADDMFDSLFDSLPTEQDDNASPPQSGQNPSSSGANSPSRGQQPNNQPPTQQSASGTTPDQNNSQPDIAPDMSQDTGQNADQDNPTSENGQSEDTEADGDDPLKGILEDNAEFDDLIDDYLDQIAANPLPEQAPESDDGEVDPSEIISEIASANDNAPDYTSPDPDDDENASEEKPGKASRGAAKHAYDDNRFIPIDHTTEPENQYATLRSNAAGMISTTSRTIRRLLMAESKTHVLQSRRSGQFDIRNVSAIVRETGTCYKKKWERPAPETHLTVLIDFSGSMGNGYGGAEEPLTLAVTGALAIEEATRGTQIDTSLYGYEGFSPQVRLYPFKEGKQAANDTRRKIGAYRSLGQGCTPTGEAMAAVANLLDNIPDKRRILLVLTDGMADDADLCKDVVAVLERRGIEVVAIGIKSPSVLEWCRNAHVIQNVSEIPAALLATIDPRAHKKRRLAA